jgi:hypothetical protein
VRRALLGAVQQSDYMSAVIGTDSSLWRDKVGFFPPGTPMASEVGLEALTAPRDMDKVKRDLAAAGYKGEKVVVIAASDFPTLNALAQVGRDMLTRAGMNVDYVSTDWGSVVQRRANREAPERGGWSVFFTFFAGLDFFSPASHLGLRGNGPNAWFGWPTLPRLEELRTAWLEAPDTAAQQKLAAEIQTQAFQDVPYLPVGQYFQPWTYRRGISGVLKGCRCSGTCSAPEGRPVRKAPPKQERPGHVLLPAPSEPPAAGDLTMRDEADDPPSAVPPAVPEAEPEAGGGRRSVVAALGAAAGLAGMTAGAPRRRSARPRRPPSHAPRAPLAAWKGQSVLVTGAARGIGRAICLAAAREGADVLGFDIAGPASRHVGNAPSTPWTSPKPSGSSNPWAGASFPCRATCAAARRSRAPWTRPWAPSGSWTAWSPTPASWSPTAWRR